MHEAQFDPSRHGADAANSQTCDAPRITGSEVNVRRLMRGPRPDVWILLINKWMPHWLGIDRLPQMMGATLATHGRKVGRVIGCQVGTHIRVRWTPATLNHETVFQVRLHDHPSGTYLDIHHEHLLGPGEQSGLIERWARALDDASADVRMDQDMLRRLHGPEN
ncbi:hypothetical protein [Devriesea agamarum]|uniref:hypothetical protein n=1 Tax=Devriesea agamarum TaxID=472569 RepID=UPI0012ECEB20|nr:hypothetical protein [Devriesea agamarum]